MKQAFPAIVDVNFTANLEMLLDKVEDGGIAWKTVVRNFYPDFEEALKAAQEELEKVEIADEVTDVVCEECGRNMVIKYGPYGKFLACPGFPAVFYFDFKWTVSAGSFGIYPDYFIVTNYLDEE